MIPDVHYHTGPSHSDQLDSVESAVKKVIEMGVVDPKHIGLNGHSYGGEGAAFIATRSRLFAAVGVGAGVVDLFNDFNMNWGWSYQVRGGSGANGDDYYLYGQGREAVSPWDKPDMYHFESALTHVPEVTQPILIMHGTADPTVGFINGLAFYNALRYNGKNAILLAYPGEGHGLRGLANRKDLTIRYFQFFDHYLKGAPAPKWMTDGVPYLDKDAAKEGGTAAAAGTRTLGGAHKRVHHEEHEAHEETHRIFFMSFMRFMVNATWHAGARSVVQQDHEVPRERPKRLRLQDRELHRRAGDRVAGSRCPPRRCSESPADP